MALQIFGLRDHPNAMPVSKTKTTWEECVFLLDFSRSLKYDRFLFGKSFRFGIPVFLTVPVVHAGEREGGFVITVNMNTPYFKDIPKYWKKFKGTKRTFYIDKPHNLSIIADFANNFPEDAS